MPYKTFDDLSDRELEELAQHYLVNHMQGGVSWGELASASEWVPMNVLREEYGGVSFTDDDFFCNM